MRTTVEILLSQRSVQVLLLVATVAAGLVAMVLKGSRRLWCLPAALTWVCGAIVAVTLNAGDAVGGLSGDPGGRLRQCWRGLGEEAARAALTSSDGALNVFLFIPLGALVYLASRRVWLTVGAAAAFSLVIELAQIFLVAHDCSSVDWLSNVTGALIGATATAWAGGLRRAMSPAEAQPPAERVRGR